MRAFALASISVLVLTALVCLVSGHDMALGQVPSPLHILAVSLILFVVAALRRPRPRSVRRPAASGVMAAPALEESWGQK